MCVHLHVSTCDDLFSVHLQHMVLLRKIYIAQLLQQKRDVKCDANVRFYCQTD